MTGYGRAEHRQGNVDVAVEVRTVNHRFSELSLKLPRAMVHLERRLKQQAANAFARGRVDLSVSISGRGGQSRQIVLDPDLTSQYIRQLRRLQHQHGLRGELQIGDLSGVRELLTINEFQPAPRVVDPVVGRLLSRAIQKAQSMRRTEGRALARDLQRRLQRIEQAVRRVTHRLPTVLSRYQQRLQARVSELAGVPIQQERLAQEVALYAERCDVTEELVRLSSHLRQFRSHVKSVVPVGRTMEFLIQEMNREINTLGSKANDSVISTEVIALKAELEKIREQVQNVE